MEADYKQITVLHNAFAAGNLDALQIVLDDQTNESAEAFRKLVVKVSYSEKLQQIITELCIPHFNKATLKDYCIKHAFFFDDETAIILRIQYLLLNNISVVLEVSDLDETEWQKRAPELTKMLLLHPINTIEYNQNPEQYKKEHPQDFDPVARFPKAFYTARKRQTPRLLKKITKKYGTISNYIKQRELGALFHS